MSPNRLTRREMLKAILAAGGAVSAALFIPEKWLKPVVGSGVLPAHAQGSVPPNLGNITGIAFYRFFTNTKPIEDVTVNLYEGFIGTLKSTTIPEPLQTTKTDANGNFGFFHLPAGQYTVMLMLDPFPFQHIDLGPGEDANTELVIDNSDN